MPEQVLAFFHGTLLAWVPERMKYWAVPAALIHCVMFAILLIPAWVALARARAFGPLAIFLAIPVLGLWVLFLRLLNRVLPYAGWWRIWAVLALIPGINIFFVWVLAFAPWRRRYVPPDYDNESDEQADASAETPSARTGTRRNTMSPELPGERPAPKFGSRTQPAPARRTQEIDAPSSATMIAGGAFPGQGASKSADAPERIASLTIMAGTPGAAAKAPGIAAPTILAGDPAMPGTPAGRDDAGSPQTMIAGAPGFRPASPPPDGGTIIAGVPGRPAEPAPRAPEAGEHTLYPGSPAHAAATTAAATPAAARPKFGRAQREAASEREAPPSSPPAPPPPPEEEEVEQPTVRTVMVSSVGGRNWRITGANDAAADLVFALQELTLRDSENGILVGRSNRAGVTIQHQSISRNHARFVLLENELCVEDLELMNGTWVNGAKLEPNRPVALAPDSVIEFGKVMMRVAAA